MSVKEILNSNWKSPELNAEETQFEVRKKDLKQKLEQIESRLESVDILVSNDKPEDANILINLLVYDLVNCYQMLHDGKQFLYDGDLSSFTTPETKTKAFGFLKSFSKQEKKDEAKLNEVLDGCIITFDFLTKESKKLFRTKWFTRLDQFNHIRKIRIILTTSILSLLIFGIFYYQYKFPTFKDQTIKMYTFVDKDHPQTSDLTMVSLPVSKSGLGEWNEYVFTLPEPMSKFGGLRMDPLEQRGIRFVLDDLQILDAKGKVLYSKKITVSESLIPQDVLDYLKISDIKTAGKQQPGELLEMITTGRDPQIHLVFPTVEGAKMIKVKMKYIEAHKVKKK
ncbi:hypothetical protein [Leptospira levettii]|uniref:hypothetical protein n=1 Tax=Leptospira levettii TaxID=2023178 RepID=UPI001A9C85FA|nr:hypothetical protein [Leptospira levettii]MCW7472933.1 hypothetical protein [Leptospira levettii]